MYSLRSLPTAESCNYVFRRIGGRASWHLRSVPGKALSKLVAELAGTMGVSISPRLHGRGPSYAVAYEESAQALQVMDL